MLMRGSGRIINVASFSGKEGNPNMNGYSSFKAELIGFTNALAKESRATNGILVNCITPAVIRDRTLDRVDQGGVSYMITKIP